MNRYLDLSIKELHELLLEKKITPLDLVEETYSRIEENSDLNSFITLNKSEALAYAKKLGEEEVEKDNLLWGIPIAIKDNISTKKSTIGATMNRLDAALTSLTTVIENNTAAKSTIMDADIAEESAEYTKQQILQQTSSALLVQANQLPSLALNLIQ